MSSGASPAFLDVMEPAGARKLPLPLRVGGQPAAVVLPGVAAGEFLQLVGQGSDLQLQVTATRALALNGETLPLGSERRLLPGDVISFGAARLLLRAPANAADTLARLELRHLAGNDTAPPLKPTALRAALADSEDARIEAVALGGRASATLKADGARAAPARLSRAWLWGGLAAALLLAAVVLLSQLQSVALSLSPTDAKVRADGLLTWQSGATLTVWPGERKLTAERPGYRTLTRTLQVGEGRDNRIELVLGKLPGQLSIDTQGLAATVLVDGAVVGRAPGPIELAAGRHTLLLRAERHVDAIVPVEIAGMGQRQTIRAVLQPSWGKLEISSNTPGAQLQINGEAAQTLPLQLDLPAGVQQLLVSARGAREWRSSVLIRAGETSRVGPIVLGAPDAQLQVRSQPPGASVSISGVWRGRTPLQLALPPGARYDVLVALPGYQSESRVVDAAAGARLAVDARLTAILVGLSIGGEPADAEIWIDGVAQGRAPRTLQLLAGAHRVEVRRAGMQSWTASVDLAPGVARALDYRLLPEGKPAGWTAPAATASAKGGPALRLIAGGTFTMGSARREQGRRPNEGNLRVTLSRPYYIGTQEVTNGQFRKFRAEHSSGIVNQRSIDLDSQPVSKLTWEQAVEYCNWLSAQEGLPAAYESKDGSWVLRMPANNGYRLPTEAEWEFAARSSANGLRRFEWGDELPVPQATVNIAGGEAAKIVEPVLPGYRDEFESVAPVARFTANTFGLHDMTGNVSEWTHDVYASFVDSTPVTDPFGPATGPRHVIRGASWRSSTISELRLAWRDGASEPAPYIGFRVARYAE